MLKTFAYKKRLVHWNIIKNDEEIVYLYIRKKVPFDTRKKFLKISTKMQLFDSCL